MKGTGGFWAIIIVSGLLWLGAGCGWLPERDNPRDPESSFYQEPPPPNVAPEIDTVYMVTDCRNHISGQFCAFTVYSHIADENGNLDFDHILARAHLTNETIELGNLNYDPDSRTFSLFRTQNDFANQTLNPLIGRPLEVVAWDHESLYVSETIIFQEPLTRFPLMIHPLDEDHVPTVHPTLGWAYWGDTLSAQTFDVSVYLQGYFLEWDTVGLSAADTAVTVTAELQASNSEPQIFYTWTLTAVDERGNRATAKPQNFSVLIPDTLLGLTEHR